jgi:hypothetical protein
MKPGGRPFIPRDHSGTADPLRGWKMSAWDGGCRVPFVARWPGKIPGGRVSDGIFSTMDLLPTFAQIAAAKLPEDRALDGRDGTRFLTGETDTSPREDYLYYTGCLLTGVRVGQWKLVLPRPANPPGTGWWGRMIEAVKEPSLFDLDADPGETTNLAAKHPDVVARLMRRIEKARAELGDIDRTGSGSRFFDPGERLLESSAKKQASAKPATAAYDGFKPVGNLRFRFEGDDMDGWRITEGTFAQAVTAMPSLPRFQDQPFAREGAHYLSTVALADGKSAADSQVGVIQSPAFKLEGDQAAFLVSGGFDKDKLFIALVDADTDEVLIRGGGENDTRMHRVIWDVSKWKGRSVRFQVVDRKTAGWGHLNADDFSVRGTLLP